MAFEQPGIALELADAVRLPLTESAPSGPGAGGGSRPPTTGMLPGDSSEHRPMSCLLVAMKPGLGRTLVDEALIRTERRDKQAPMVLHCLPDAMEDYARAAHPNLIVIEDRGVWRPSSRQCAACRRLKRDGAPGTRRFRVV